MFYINLLTLAIHFEWWNCKLFAKDGSSAPPQPLLRLEP
jgi:hypothetical protein